MKIIVTGGCGFIGSNYIIYNASQNKNFNILNVDNLTYSGNHKNLSAVQNSSNYKFVKADICDNKLLTSIFNDFKPDAIVHFAAESHVDRSIDDPMTFINTNIIGTANLLQISKRYYDKTNRNFKFLHVSTDEVYGSLRDSGSFTEKSSYNPSSPYSASKASSDHLVRAWGRTYDLPTLITNCSNNFGPFQFPEKLIPLIITNCIDNKTLPIYGDGLNVRDWLFVDDHCRALDLVLKKGISGETYNIGSNNDVRNIDIVKSICSILDELRPLSNKSYIDLIKYVNDRPGHDYRYSIDSSKITSKLGWKPLNSFNINLKKTISWYIDNESWWRKF